MEKGAIIRKGQIKYINENDYKRIFIISDLHGYYNLFLEFIKKVDLQKDDLLINLGDSCDRGSQSYELYLKYYEMIKEGYNILHILGNHEDMILTAIDTLDESDIEHWYRSNGETTIDSFCNVTGLSKKDFFDKEKNKFLIDFLSTFPTLIISDKSIFVHAAYNPDLLPEKQEEYFLIWNRQNFWDRNFTGKAIYFGHTPSKKDNHTIVYYPNNCTCIDLGTYKYHKMVGVEIKNKMEYYIEEKYIYNGNHKERFILGEVTGAKPLICFGVNPSRAKVQNGILKTDPTILKIKKFAEKRNCDGWIMLNLYPQVTPQPDELHKNENFDNCLHEKNINIIKEIFKNYPSAEILVCWGNLIEKRDYLKKVCLKEIFEISKSRDWFHIGNLTKKGNPRHPLSPYADINKELEEFDINEYVKNI